METPSSMRRITRSQAAAFSNQACKQVEAAKSTPSTERRPLLDITNDSPIVGLAVGSLHSDKTPSSRAAKGRPLPKNTPGSGEALLRCQVKTLLQKVEEEGGIMVTKPPSAADPVPPFRVMLAMARSPGQLLAPTPANTPQIEIASAVTTVDVGFALPCVIEQEEEDTLPKQAASSLKKHGEDLLADYLPNRALLFDSPDKSDSSPDILVISQESVGSYQTKCSEDDTSSAWSIQVNVSSEKNDLDDEEPLDVEYDSDWEEEEEEAAADDYGFDELCNGLSRMSVFEEAEDLLPKGQGMLKRFIYDSDGELKQEVEVLRGLPVPEGKHLRFPEEEDDE